MVPRERFSEALAEHLTHCRGFWDPWWSILRALVKHLTFFRALESTFEGPRGRTFGHWWVTRAHARCFEIDFWSLGGPSWHLEGVLGDHGGSRKDMGRSAIGFLAILELCRDTILKAAPTTNSQIFSRLFPHQFLYSSLSRNLDCWGS